MSLPGLDLTQATAERQYAPVPPTEITLPKGSEWRFEVSFGAIVRVKLLDGTAELFGTELAPFQTYTFSGAKAAIYTWHGCTLEVGEDSKTFTVDGSTSSGTNRATAGDRSFGAGGCQSEYTAEETPMVEYANVHFALETMRQEAKASGKDGPRVLILGPEDAGKTSLAKILTAYAMKVGRQPITVNLDPGEALLSVPGTLSAVAFRTMIDIEEGWGSSPMSQPSPVPVKLPIVYCYPFQSPLEARGSIYRSIVSKLALSVVGRMTEDEDSREAGIIVDTPGILSQGKPGAEEMINHIVAEFSITTIVVIGSERLYSSMARNYSNKPSTSASAAASGERITVVKLSKSGGCVDRDDAFMKAVRETQIRSYFFGSSIPSTAASAPSLSTSSATSITLSPHTQQLDYSALTVYDITMPAAQSADEDEDEYDPAQLPTGSAFLPGDTTGVNRNGLPSETLPASAAPFQKAPSPVPVEMTNSLLAISHAPPNARPAEIRDSSIMGFLYVVDVDSEKGRVRVLSPVGGRVPSRAIIWNRRWPEPVIGLVG